MNEFLRKTEIGAPLLEDLEASATTGRKESRKPPAYSQWNSEVIAANMRGVTPENCRKDPG